MRMSRVLSWFGATNSASMSDGEVWVTLVQVTVVLTKVPDKPLTLMTDG